MERIDTLKRLVQVHWPGGGDYLRARYYAPGSEAAGWAYLRDARDAPSAWDIAKQLISQSDPISTWWR